MTEIKKSRAGRPPGLPKTGGKKKGVVQKVENQGIENALRLFINGKFEKATKTWEEIEDPYQKFTSFIKILEFVYPKKRSVDFKGEIETTSLEVQLAAMYYKGAENKQDDENE